MGMRDCVLSPLFQSGEKKGENETGEAEGWVSQTDQVHMPGLWVKQDESKQAITKR